MSWPPYLLKIRLENEHNSFPIWLPLFLVWPIVLAFLLAIFLVILPFALLSVIFTSELGWFRPIYNFIPALIRLFSQLSGLKIDVGGSSGRVYIVFI